jgi:hypothetical protein
MTVSTRIRPTLAGHPRNVSAYYRNQRYFYIARKGSQAPSAAPFPAQFYPINGQSTFCSDQKALSKLIDLSVQQLANQIQYQQALKTSGFSTKKIDIIAGFCFAGVVKIFFGI